MTDSQTLLAEIAALTQRLATHQAGKRGKLSLSPEAAAWFATVAGPSVSSVSTVAAVAAPDVSAISPGDFASLDEVAAAVKGCTQCALSETRTQTVFCDGTATADLMFIGEAPGADEDRQGVPFVGRAGQLLTRIIENGMKMRREDVYICNVLKCRPPGNRDPEAPEKAACIGYLRAQIAFVKPKAICCLGKQAANTILGMDETIAKLRGKWHFYEGIPVRVTYHPSYLLRCEDDPERAKTEKKKVWDDVQQVMRVLNGQDHPRAV